MTSHATLVRALELRTDWLELFDRDDYDLTYSTAMAFLKYGPTLAVDLDKYQKAKTICIEFLNIVKGKTV